MTNYDEPITISHGMDVLGSDGEKVGDVADMRGDYVIVSRDSSSRLTTTFRRLPSSPLQTERSTSA